MRILKTLSYKYAIILNELSDQKLIEVLKSLSHLKDEKIRSFIVDPTVSAEKKAKMIAEAFMLNEKAGKFIELIFEHKRFNLIGEIADMSEKMSMRSNGMEKVKVRSAISLTKDEVSAIIDVIKKVRKTEPVIELEKDETLLAGVIIDFEDSMFDLSAAGTLKEAAAFIIGG